MCNDLIDLHVYPLNVDLRAVVLRFHVGGDEKIVLRHDFRAGDEACDLIHLLTVGVELEEVLDVLVGKFIRVAVLDVDEQDARVRSSFSCAA